MLVSGGELETDTGEGYVDCDAFCAKGVGCDAVDVGP